jgi:large subunit ribosomal protein L25
MSAAIRQDTLGGTAEAWLYTPVFGSGKTPVGGPPQRKKGIAMSQVAYELKAELRDRVGKGSSRELRRKGLVPAVIYGDKQAPVSIALPVKELTLKIHGGGFMTTVATIDVDGKKISVLPKDYQLDPVKDTTVHVDFLRVSATTQVTVDVPVHFVNQEKSPGIKLGGVLNIVRHEIEVHCPANAIPEFITADLSGLKIGDGIHISHIKLPEGVTPAIADRDFTVATIVAPASGAATEEEAAPAAEG